MTQYFADRPEAERQALKEFFEMLKNYRVLVHFNGDGFDIPYLLKRCAHHKLDYNFDGVASLDIYKKIRPLKKLLGLDSLKQKAIERFLGVDRTDVFSGGELIDQTPATTAEMPGWRAFFVSRFPRRESPVQTQSQPEARTHT